MCAVYIKQVKIMPKDILSNNSYVENMLEYTIMENISLRNKNTEGKTAFSTNGAGKTEYPSV